MNFQPITSRMVKFRPGAKFSTRKPAGQLSMGLNNAVIHLAQNLACGTAYAFRVSGMGYGSPYSTDYGDTAEVTSSIPCPAPMPANFMVDDSATTQISITLKWDTDANVAAYKLERSDDGGSTWPQLGDADYAMRVIAVAPTPTPASTSYKVENLTCGTDYAFRVSGIGAAPPTAALYTAPCRLR